jgi:DNA invertase Pin-like site-specific DNA recombinase
MKALYVRISTIDQKTDRQKVNEKDFDFVIEDNVSGVVPFFERQGGKEILKLVKKDLIKSISVYSIDRLGRNLLDIMNTIDFFSNKNIPIEFINQGLITLTQDGKENPISKLVISILASVAEMERAQIRERQLEGIKIAKLKGAYKGRKQGTKEDVLAFLSKEKNKKALELLKKGYKCIEVAKILELHVNTITKIKKLGFPQ